MLGKSYAEAINHPIYGKPVLDQFVISEDNFIGAGRHSRVYVIDRASVLRVYAPEVSLKYVESLASFYKNLDNSAVD